MVKPVVQTKEPAHTLTNLAKPVPSGVRTDGAATRGLILQAARRRLVEEGYANLSVREIAADAGVNSP